MAVETILLISVILLAALWYFANSKPKDFPPGPPRLPIFGGLTFLGNPPHQGLRKLKQQYGKIYGIYCGNYPAVIINDLKLIKDAFKDDRISARPPLRPFLERSWGHRKGLIFGTGEEWMEQRKFAIGAFKSLGFGTGLMENAVLDEVIELNKRLRSDLNHPISINHHFHVAIVNTLWHIIAGSRFDYDDPDLAKLIEMTGHVVRFRSLDSDSFMPMILFFMPWLTKIAPQLSGWTKFLASFKAIFPVLEKYIEGHKKNFNPDDDAKDFIDLYLQKIHQTADKSSSFFQGHGEKSLLIILLDLFLAGGETASSNLTWGFLFLGMYPEIQAKIHKELDHVVGKNRLPSLADRQKMPYLEAFINEYLRMVTIGAISIFHSTTEEMKFHGYRLPKDCIVFGNFWEVHHDPEVWGDPQNFRPERFLEAGKRDKLNVFSTGKRICPGESLARDELFLFTAGILQNFRFEQDPDGPPPCLDPMKAAVLRAHTSKVIIRERI